MTTGDNFFSNNYLAEEKKNTSRLGTMNKKVLNSKIYDGFNKLLQAGIWKKFENLPPSQSLRALSL